MRGLSSQRSTAIVREDRGAVATIVAALLGFGVLLGFVALSIDVGGLMWERRQVQNGADAVALSMAQSCAEDPAACVAGGADQPLIDSLNNANALDGAGGYDASTYLSGLCGRNNSLPYCQDGSISKLYACPPVPTTLAADVPFVEAHAETRSFGGDSILPTWLIRTLPGGSQGETVRACARAAYGAPGPTTATAPITFSTCEWRANTASGASYVEDDPKGVPGYGGTNEPPWPSPATDPPTAGGEIVIQLKGQPKTPNVCKNWNNHDIPGGFGYLTTGGTACSVADLSDGNWVNVDTGNSTQCDLSTYVGKVVYLPVFDCLLNSLTTPAPGPLPSTCEADKPANGQKAWYHIAGWAKFYLSGYKTGGTQEAASLVSKTVPCSGGDRCISGWFLEGVLRDAPVAGPPPPPGSPNYGTYAVQPAG